MNRTKGRGKENWPFLPECLSWEIALLLPSAHLVLRPSNRLNYTTDFPGSSTYRQQTQTSQPPYLHESILHCIYERMDRESLMEETTGNGRQQKHQGERPCFQERGGKTSSSKKNGLLFQSPPQYCVSSLEQGFFLLFFEKSWILTIN